MMRQDRICINVHVYSIVLAETYFCWAFSISSMIRHSLNYFVRQLARERPRRFDRGSLCEALQYLNSLGFHKRLRIGSYNTDDLSLFESKYKSIKRNELIMIPIPKPKFFQRKVPAGQSEDDYFDDITARQAHILRDAIDRVSSVSFFSNF